jgi:hypothetical protein
MRATPLAGALLLVLSVPALAAAQDPDARLRISVNGGLAAAGRAFAQDFTVPKNAQEATISADVAQSAAPMFDISGWVRLAGRVGAGVAFSTVSRSSDASIAASIPHPFYFNQFRAISGTQSNVTSRERAVHLDAVVIAASTDRIELAVFAGATLFSVRQDLITDVAYIESYPYDTAEFRTAKTVRDSQSKVGYNVGTDVSWALSEHVGIGGLLRFSRADVTYAPSAGNVASAKVGGLQAGGGLRLRF